LLEALHVARVLPLAPASRATVALAALALAGCAAAERTVAPPADSPRALVVSPALLAAVGDAELRLLPSVDAALRRPALAVRSPNCTRRSTRGS
jgi:hypothetical protein